MAARSVTCAYKSDDVDGGGNKPSDNSATMAASRPSLMKPKAVRPAFAPLLCTRSHSVPIPTPTPIPTSALSSTTESVSTSISILKAFSQTVSGRASVPSLEQLAALPPSNDEDSALREVAAVEADLSCTLRLTRTNSDQSGAGKRHSLGAEGSGSFQWDELIPIRPDNPMIHDCCFEPLDESRNSPDFNFDADSNDTASSDDLCLPTIHRSASFLRIAPSSRPGPTPFTISTSMPAPASMAMTRA